MWQFRYKEPKNLKFLIQKTKGELQLLTKGGVESNII